ncbi:unnamed protein product [Acanthoscelides obtectus]|uniref:Regucalcin n=1 Tax=Acanthoscelides obtectus TaxID=200917 RepID=A0A9P0LPQ0_ACAOB|nr:unnamed protein product [Acanthoscelides obtectus]CAK1668289.1 Regucalcin [Acanthoscelides obtectus]
MKGFIILYFVIWSVKCSDDIPPSFTDFDGPYVVQVTSPVDHAEEPHWDGRKNILYYVDIHAGGVLAYHFYTKKVSKITLNGEASPVVPARNNPNVLLVGLNRSVVVVEWDGKKQLGDQEILSTISQQFPKSRFNDGKADKQGRLWWGTIGPEANGHVTPNEGVLYKFTRENLQNPEVVRAPVTNSNGLAWNKANNKMYYIDTPTLKVVEFDYDDRMGTISKENRTVFDMRDYKGRLTGLPDGMTIDDEDNLYIALYGGGAILKVNPTTKKLLKVIPIPARDVTSAMFGGPNLDILFVTTSRVSLSANERLFYPAAGSLFAVKNLKAKGLPAFTADVADGVTKRLNLLENLFTPEIFYPTPKESKTVTRNTEIPLWQTLMNTLRAFF